MMNWATGYAAELVISLEGLPPKEASHNYRAGRGSRMVQTRSGGQYSATQAQAVAHWREYTRARTQAAPWVFTPNCGSFEVARLGWWVRFEVKRFSTFALDEANAIERMAPLLDGLVLAGLVQNDTWQQVHMLQGPERVRGPQDRTIITVRLWR